MFTLELYLIRCREKRRHDTFLLNLNALLFKIQSEESSTIQWKKIAKANSPIIDMGIKHILNYGLGLLVFNNINRLLIQFQNGITSKNIYCTNFVPIILY